MYPTLSYESSDLSNSSIEKINYKYVNHFL